MDYVYAALLLHSLGKEVTEENMKNVIKATGSEVDEAKIKVLVDALKGVDIDKEIKEAQTMSMSAPVAAGPAPSAPAENKEKKEEEEKKAEESAAAGLSSLFE
ncbi:MAG: 50S ribosomal protein P1 [Candidatus Rehaiarchaeum fermentans]|nr:50S ribosomal protein P1 [Candidatus Rehaiarchaeum fermentans]